MGLYSGGLIIGRIFASEIWEAYFREGLFISIFIFILIYIYFFLGGGGGLIIDDYNIVTKDNSVLTQCWIFNIYSHLDFLYYSHSLFINLHLTAFSLLNLLSRIICVIYQK